MLNSLKTEFGSGVARCGQLCAGICAFDVYCSRRKVLSRLVLLACAIGVMIVHNSPLYTNKARSSLVWGAFIGFSHRSDAWEYGSVLSHKFYASQIHIVYTYSESNVYWIEWAAHPDLCCYVCCCCCCRCWYFVFGHFSAIHSHVVVPCGLVWMPLIDVYHFMSPSLCTFLIQVLSHHLRTYECIIPYFFGHVRNCAMLLFSNCILFGIFNLAFYKKSSYPFRSAAPLNVGWCLNRFSCHFERCIIGWTC